MTANVPKRTKWEGIWYSDVRHGLYMSQPFKKTEIEQTLNDVGKYGRIIFMNNKYWKKDTNRPRYVFSIINAEGVKQIQNITLEHFEEYDDDYPFTYGDQDESNDKYCFTAEELQDLINRIACEVGGDSEYGEHLISDFIY